MIPFANDTVTLFHKTAAGYERHVIAHCSYRRTRRRAVADQTATFAEETLCRIPCGAVMPEAGDVILLGAHDGGVSSEIELVRLLESRRPAGAFRVQTVLDNARPGMPIPHYAVRGE